MTQAVMRGAEAALRRLAHGAALAGALALAPLAAAQSPPAPTFDIQRFSVEGNTLLDAVGIEAALAGHAGSARSFADVQAAVAALQLAYARAGYGAVRVVLPEQEVATGTVRIAVVEPRLRKVSVEGAPDSDGARIRRALPALRDGTTPNTDALARELALANENPTRRISVDLRSDSPGEIDALVSVAQDRPARVGLVFDSTGTSATGRTRIGGFFQHANVAELDHVATLQYVTSPTQPEDVTIAALNYRIPLPSFGDALDLYAVYANVDAGVVGDLFSVRGSGTVLGIRYSQNLRPSTAWRHRLLYGFEQRPTDNQVGLVQGGADLASDITVHPASIGYAANWSDASRQVDFSVTGVHNIPRGSKGRSEAFEAARAGASANYAILRYAAKALQSLPGDWQVRVAFDGQYTRDALVSSEQFGIGGQDSVRGFDERELSNDVGNHASLELHSPDFGERVGPGVFARALVFLDHGWLRRNHALPGEADRSHISSVGAGLRLSLPPSWSVRLDLARVTQGTDTRPRGDDRILFGIGYAY